MKITPRPGLFQKYLAPRTCSRIGSVSYQWSCPFRGSLAQHKCPRISDHARRYATGESSAFKSDNATIRPKEENGDALPLRGITVVSLEQAIAAPFCTRQLADMGARVIKVERPGVGDFARNYDTRVNGMASHFVWTNRSKESLALDVKKPEDLKIL